MWLKKKDKVIVLSGKDKGKRGEVLSRAKDGMFIVSKINLCKKHQRARPPEPGGIIAKEAPVHQSKIMLVCPRCDSPTKVKIKFLENQEKVRICRNCSEMIE